MRADGGGSPREATRLRDGFLVLLAVAAGVVDAISLTSLGVFTAAVTANLVLIGLAIGDSDAHTALRAGLAFAGFAVGVLAAERALAGTAGRERPRRAPAVLAGIACIQTAFLVGWLTADGRPDGIWLDLLAVGSAVAMGGQSVVTRVWHKDITTTYISGTLTLLLTEVAAADRSRHDRLLRICVLVAVAAGATVGALMLSHAHSPAAAVPVALTLIVTIGAAALSRARR